MKTFGKKLISLMLVALMLVAAVPFGVFAEEENIDTQEAVVVDDVDGGAAYQELVRDVTVDLIVKDDNGKTLYTGKTKITNQYSSLESDEQESLTKKIYNGLSFANKSAYDRTDAGTFDGLHFTIAVSVNPNHTPSTSLVKYDKGSSDANQPDEEYHYYVCSICGDTAKEGHTWKTTKGDENGHVKVCTVCGYQAAPEDHENSGEKVTVTAEKPATCTSTGTTEKKVYACGYVEGGETIAKTAHSFDENGKCTVCGTYDSDSTTDYTVTIQYKTKEVVKEATLVLTPAEVSKIKSAFATNGAKIVLGKAEGASDDDDKIISAYYGSSDIFTSVAFSGNNIVITVTKDLSSQVSSDTVTVDVVDGNETEQRVLTVGAKYFNLGLALTNSNNKTLASIRVTDTDGVSRTIRSTDTGSDSKVKLHDAIVELLWDAKEVTIEFYRHGGNGAKKVDTMTIRAGEAISGLPLLDGNYVTWYLESGELLQEGRTYDFKSTTIKAYPSTNGDVYLMIYKNGDTKTPVRSNPENVTAYVQNNGLISVKDLKTVVENVVGKKGTAYLFDFDGWENYKATKSTKDSADTFDVGTADSRTGVQFLYVMVTGASGSSNADSSNPKTGDTAMIGTATAVLAIAALGLGTATVVLKKKEEF